MKVLLVGSGGREHAIAWALSDVELFAAVDNRNPGIVKLAKDVEEMDTKDPVEVVDYAEKKDVDIAIVGPEAPLAAGVSDELEKTGIYCFGPKKEDAKIETDKPWARRFMKENGIEGCPSFEVFEDPDEAVSYIESRDGDVAVKPEGLTGGKGVKVTGDQISKDEAKEYIQDMIGKESYESFIIEDRLIGEEFTLQAFVANGEIQTMPAVQDHKRAYEGEKGPNTGGMGSYNDSGNLLPFMEQKGYDDAVSIMQETIEELDSYRGILYGQFMLTADGPKVVEFNARFGDPEAMNVLPILETPLKDILKKAKQGTLPEVSFSKKATVCKYAVPSGYPENREKSKGKKITPKQPNGNDTILFYASVEEKQGNIYTTTSRSYATVGIGETIEKAEKKAGNALNITEPLRARHDIGKKQLIEQKIQHIKTLKNK